MVTRLRTLFHLVWIRLPRTPQIPSEAWGFHVALKDFKGKEFIDLIRLYWLKWFLLGEIFIIEIHFMFWHADTVINVLHPHSVVHLPLVTLFLWNRSVSVYHRVNENSNNTFPFYSRKCISNTERHLPEMSFVSPVRCCILPCQLYTMCRVQSQ